MSAGLARGYVDCGRPFVAVRARGDVLDFADLTATEVTAFVLAPAPAELSGLRS
jgi:hypothetical protein